MIRTIALITALLCLFTGATCAGQTPATIDASAPPDITVIGDGVPLPSTVGLNVWNGAMVKRMNTLEYLVTEGRTAPYVPMGAEIVFRIDEPLPGKVALAGHLLTVDENGTVGGIAAQGPVDFSYENGTCRFILPPGTAPDSPDDAVSPGLALRGFTVTCTWGENVCEYAFLLKTDAGLAPLQTIAGKIADATMNTLTIETEDGQKLSFMTEDADTSRADGLILGSEITVHYIGEIKEGDAADALAVALVQH